MTDRFPRPAATSGRCPRHELECGRRLCEHVLLLELAVGQGVGEQLYSAVVFMVLNTLQTIKIQMQTNP